jgi:hypothetical protein
MIFAFFFVAQPLIILIQNLTGILSSADWARFEHYATHVGKLSCGFDEELEDIEGDLSSVLEGHPSRLLGGSQERGLLPKLTHLSWNLHRVGDLRALCKVLSASLVSLRLVWDSIPSPFSRSVLPLVEHIQLRSPAIREFSFLPPYGTDDDHVTSINDAIISLLTSHHNIRRLQLGLSTFASILKRMPTLPQLASLELKATPALTIPDQSIFASFPPNLPALEKVSMENCRITFCNHFFPMCGHLIRHLDVELPGNDEPAEVSGLFSCIGDFCPSLQDLVITDLDLDDSTFGQMRGLLRPLMNCAQLRSLDISSSLTSDDVSYTISDSEMLEMAKVWPCLEFLRFHSRAFLSNERPPLSLAAVHILSAYCIAPNCIPSC